MIIERQGFFTDGRERFDCVHCGTVFVAEIGEYKIVQEYEYIPPNRVAKCPVCGKRCTKTAYSNLYS